MIYYVQNIRIEKKITLMSSNCFLKTFSFDRQCRAHLYNERVSLQNKRIYHFITEGKV
jgi:hypothetical protein